MDVSRVKFWKVDVIPFFWYDNDKDLKGCFLVTRIMCKWLSLRDSHASTSEWKRLILINLFWSKWIKTQWLIWSCWWKREEKIWVVWKTQYSFSLNDFQQSYTEQKYRQHTLVRISMAFCTKYYTLHLKDTCYVWGKKQQNCSKKCLSDFEKMV